MPGPLAHLRVLDLSRIFAGPWATQLLGDLGADIIKVERPGSGDDTRTWGPPFVRDTNGRETGETGYFLCMNRAKRSVTIDLGSDAGRGLVRALAAHCDVLVENFRAGTLARMGLGWEDLRAVNPRLVYCSVTGFGQDGPYRDKAAYDFIIQGMGGLMSVTGEREDRPGGGPQKVGVALADLMTGMYAATAVLAAVAHRDRTGEGQHIDIAMLDVQVAAMANQAMNYLTTGRSPRCGGNAHPNIVPQSVFETADGRLILVVGNDGQFRRLCEVIGLPLLADDPRFATKPARVRHRDTLDAEVQAALRRRGSAEWVAALDAANVPCGPINDMAQVFADPHTQARALRRDLPHPACGSVPQVANPIRYSGTPVEYERPPPTLGQHTDEVLRELLGIDPSETARLRQAGAV